MLQPAQSVMHRKPPALRLPVPSLLCHQAHTSPIKEFPALQGTHDHRRLCPSLSLNYSFFWACLVCLAAPQAQPWGAQQRGHSGDIQRCAIPCPEGSDLLSQEPPPELSWRKSWELSGPSYQQGFSGGRNLPGSASSTRRGTCSHAKQPGNETLLHMPAAVTPT